VIAVTRIDLGLNQRLYPIGAALGAAEAFHDSPADYSFEPDLITRAAQ